MPYILPLKFVPDIEALRHEYEKRKDIEKLSDATQPSTSVRFFGDAALWLGGIDVKGRNQQITFIEKVLAAVKNELLDLNRLEFDDRHQLKLSEEQLQNHFNALCIAVAALFFVKYEINKTYRVPYWIHSPQSSDLFDLIDKALALEPGNEIDQKTRDQVMRTTKSFISYCLSSTTNPIINTLKADPKWDEFAKFIASESPKLGKEPTQYPITATTMSLFGTMAGLAGLATGVTVGQTFARSTPMAPVRATVTTAIGATLFYLSGGGGSISVGLMFVAPIYAGYIVDSLCGIGLAAILGITSKYIGRGVGFLVGMPLDLACKLTYYTASALYNSVSNAPANPEITGVSLVNSTCFIKGRQLEENDGLAAQSALLQRIIKVESTPDGNLMITDGEQIDVITIDLTKSIEQQQQEVTSKLETILAEKGVLPPAPVADYVAPIDPEVQAQITRDITEAMEEDILSPTEMRV